MPCHSLVQSLLRVDRMLVRAPHATLPAGLEVHMVVACSAAVGEGLGEYGGGPRHKKYVLPNCVEKCCPAPLRSEGNFETLFSRLALGISKTRQSYAGRVDLL